MSIFTHRRLLSLSLIALIGLSLVIAIPAGVHSQPIGHLIPIGGGYADTYAGFSKAAIANAQHRALIEIPKRRIPIS